MGSRIAEFLTRMLGVGRAAEMPRLLWVLALGGFVFTAGSSFVWPVNTVYIHFVLGQPLTVAGLVLMLSAGSSLLGQIAGGALSDRIGPRAVMLMGLSLAGAMLMVIALVREWTVYVAAMGLNGFAYGLVDPANSTLVALSWPQGGRRGFNFIYVARNAGVAIGTAIGGLVAEHSFVASFLLNAFAALLCAGLLARWVPDIRRPGALASPVRPQGAGGGHGAPEAALSPAGAGAAMGFIALAVALIWMAYSQWQAVVSVYMNSLGYSLAAYSVLWTINGVLIVVGQPAIVWVVRRALRPLTAQMIGGAALFTLAFVLVWKYPVYEGFVTGMVVLTLGEMLVLPALPAAAARLAPSGRLGLYQGILGGSVSTGRMLGPVGGGAMYDRWSPAGVLAAAAAACATAAAAFAMVRLGEGSAERATSRRPLPSERPAGRIG